MLAYVGWRFPRVVNAGIPGFANRPAVRLLGCFSWKLLTVLEVTSLATLQRSRLNVLIGLFATPHSDIGTTPKGYVGLTPAHAALGGIICIIFGAVMPYTLWESSAHWWKLRAWHLRRRISSSRPGNDCN